MNKLPVLKEAEEANILVAYLRVKGFKFTHIGNETGSSLEARRRAVRMKQQGTSPGTPDYMIIVNGSLIFIELKRVKGSTTSPEQKSWIEALNQVDNVGAFIAHGADQAIRIIENYSTNIVLKRRPYHAIKIEPIF